MVSRSSEAPLASPPEGVFAQVWAVRLQLPGTGKASPTDEESRARHGCGGLVAFVVQGDPRLASNFGSITQCACLVASVVWSSPHGADAARRFYDGGYVSVDEEVRRTSSPGAVDGHLGPNSAVVWPNPRCDLSKGPERALSESH